jgi:hypothetical protein
MAITTYNSTLKEWENIIRVNLKVTNPALLKSGALGILTNYLAGIKYDNLQFYTKAFRETNVGLAQDFNSLLYHSTIFGADLRFATPAVLTSSIIVPELRLNMVQKIEYNIPKNTTFTDSNSLSYIVCSDINVTLTSAGINATTWDKKTGTKRLSITKAANPNIPGTYLYLVHNNVIKQYQRTFQNFISTDYIVGESFEFSTGVSDIQHIKEVNVWVNTGDHIDLQLLEKIDSEDIENISIPGKNINLERYEIKFQKFGSSGSDKHIFLEIHENSLIFETGDGLHGRVIPGGAQIVTEVQMTQGADGNVPNSEFLIKNTKVTEFYNDTNVTNVYEASLNGLSTTGSSGGDNVNSVEEIRSNILSNISTRTSIVTENDYENNFKWREIKPFVDAKFMDAKAFVFLFNAIHDNDVIVPSTAVNYREIDLLNDPFYPVYEYSGVTLVSPFYYKNKSVNTIEAWALNPEYYIPWTRASDSPETNGSQIYRVELAITYDFALRKSYIEIINGANENFSYRFDALQFGVDVVLNYANNFKLPIDDRYTDQFCVLNEPLTNLTLVVEEGGVVKAKYVSEGPHHPLVLKQTFYKYFQDIVDNTSTASNFAYLNNSLSDTVSTLTDVLIGDADDQEAWILRLPFMEEAYFYKLPKLEMFEILDRYFTVKDNEHIINYNTQVTQTFHNTIDIPIKYYDYLFEKNNNGVLTKPKLPIEVNIFIDNETFLSSKYTDTNELVLDIKIFAINFLKNYEGFMVEYYETDLEKAIWNNFSPLLKNVKAESPTLYIVKNSSMIYEDIVDNLTFEDMLEFVPPYFYYDYNNIIINVES